MAGTEQEVIHAEELRNGSCVVETIALITFRGDEGEPEIELGYGQIVGEFPSATG